MNVVASTVVKICGLQSVEVLKSIINLPLNLIGFVFASSKRKVTSEQVAELLPILKNWQSDIIPQSVGVFVNPTEVELAHILSIAHLDIVQLHGEESPDFCREIKSRHGVKVYKALSIYKDGTPRELKTELKQYEGVIDGLLLDSYDPKYIGGSGEAFPWEAARPYQAWAKENGIPFFIAGGLSSDNVQDLINEMNPDGVDVSSGVETDGHKDVTKITRFVERVRQL